MSVRSRIVAVLLAVLTMCGQLALAPRPAGAAEESAPVVSPSAVRNSISRRLDIEGVSFPTMDQFRVARDGDEWVIEVSYEKVEPLFGDISLLVTFDKRVVIQ